MTEVREWESGCENVVLSTTYQRSSEIARSRAVGDGEKWNGGCDGG